MAKEKANPEKISIFISSEVLERIREKAKEKGTSVSGLVRMIILKYLAK